MALHDSDPERRNLVIASIAFIAYFYAGGSFPEATIRLQVINAVFLKPEVLQLILWVMYLWFIYRYWVTHRGSFRSEFSSELSEWKGRKYITKFVNQHFKQEMRINTTTKEYYAIGLSWVDLHVSVTCKFAKVTRDNNGNVTGSSSGGNMDETNPPQSIQLNGLKGWSLALRPLIGCIVKKPSFSGYVVPYLLVIITLFGAVKNYVF